MYPATSAGGLPFVPIGKDELMLATPKDHPLSEKVAVSLIDINNEDFVLSSDGLDLKPERSSEGNNIKPRIRYRLNEDFCHIENGRKDSTSRSSETFII